MLSINTNLSSIIAQNSMKTSTDKLNQAIERMSTGCKINHAKDNAANYAISTDMTTKIGAYQVAEDNCAQGLDMVSTASDTISMLQDKTSRLHALSTQARNGTYGAQSLNAINAEANAIMSEISRLYNCAQFNGTNLFNQKEMEIADHLPKAKAEYNGFIANPFTYTESEVASMTKLESVDENTTISSGQYSIYTLDELVQLQEMTNNGKITGGEFVLGADIDLASIDNWTPIGTVANKFKGKFDGNGHVIANLKIENANGYGNGGAYNGLFGLTGSGYIKNVGIKNLDIMCWGSIGGLVANSSTLIDNCYVVGEISSSSGMMIGGLVGDAWANINNCYTQVEIIANSSYSGGIAGAITNGRIENSYSLGNLSAKNIGGVVGNMKIAGIINCYSMGEINGSGYVGGV